ncbi:MAG: MBL fold metallo-hydrolase [Bacilli bacterium]
MKIKVLASGSKGNCTYIEYGQTRLLIDIGISYLAIAKSLESINVVPSSISGVLITHNHKDHIKGLASFIKRTNTQVYVPEGIKEQLKDIIPLANISVIDTFSQIGDFNIELFPTSHDTPYSVGYIISCLLEKLVYITDTGYINKKLFSKLKDADIYIIESNHDESLLMDGSYPYYLKQRVIGDEGHLSNHMTAEYLSKFVGEHTKYIVLAHLSENNNTEALAYQTTKDELISVNKDREIILAKQYEATALIEV